MSSHIMKSLYALPTWTRTARLIAEHTALREVIGGTPSHWACYRFAVKLREHGHMLTECIDGILARLREAMPDLGSVVAIDGSDMPAYSNGHKLHCAVDTATELPLAWTVRPANEAERGEVPGLLDMLAARGLTPSVAVMDKGYDGQPVKARGARTAGVRTWRVDLRRGRCQPERDEVALPDRAVQARVRVGQGIAAAPSDPGWLLTAI